MNNNDLFILRDEWRSGEARGSLSDGCAAGWRHTNNSFVRSTTAANLNCKT